MSEKQVYYDILDIPDNSTQEQIYASYQQQLDKHRQSHDPQAQDKIRLTEVAFQMLKAQAELDTMDVSTEIESQDDSNNTNETIEIDQSLLTDDEVSHSTDSENVPAPVEYDLMVTLEELYHGCTKQVKLNRKLVDPSTGTVIIEDKTLTQKIKPGTEIGSRFIFPQEGDQEAGYTRPADVILVVKDLPHPNFKRIGQFDLEYTVQIVKNENKEGYELTIPTLENDPIVLMIEEEEDVDEQAMEHFPGRGLLYLKGNETMRGDLFVKFKLVDEQSKPNEEMKEEEKEFTQIEMPLTLQEVFHGGRKEVSIERKVHHDDGSFEIEEQTLVVDIIPGIKSGTKLMYQKQGDKLAGQESPQDLILITQDAPHAIFDRDGCDIRCTVQVTDKQLRKREKVHIPTLDGTNLQETLSLQMLDKREKTFFGRGLPYLGDGKMRGNLIVQFDIVQDEDDDGNDDEHEEEQMDKLPSNELPLKLTLEEIFRGCAKQVRITRRITDQNGEERNENESINVHVKPGSIGGTQITIEGKGDSAHGKLPADVVFTVQEEEHAIFKRNGYDLEYRTIISPQEGILGCDLQIPTLDGPNRTLALSPGFTPDRVERIAGIGLPNPGADFKRGDLVVKFEIISDLKPKDPPIERDLPITLENIFRGCTKRLKINRCIVDNNGKETFEDEIVAIQIEPGTEAGTQFKFPQMGDQTPNSIPADIIFVLRDKPHAKFTRNGADIEYRIQVTESEVKNAFNWSVPTIEGKEIKEQFKNVSKENSVRRLSNLGLPIPGNADQRGDLVVIFDILSDDFKDPPVEHVLELTLENVLTGCEKRMKIKRNIYDENGTEKGQEEKILSMKIKPGTGSGVKFISYRAGDQNGNRIAGDVIFVIRDKPHEHFKRSGSDLYYSIQLTQSEAIRGGEFVIPTLEGESVKLPVSEAIQSDKAWRLSGRGLPKQTDPQLRGDIVVKFDIVPDPFSAEAQISNDQREVQSKSEAVDETPKQLAKPEGETTLKEEGDTNQEEKGEQDPPLIQDLPIALEDIFHGSNFIVQFTRNIMHPDGVNIAKQEEIDFPIEVLPGTVAGTRYTFAKQGHHFPGRIPSDVVYVVKDKPHDIFRRHGADLEYTAVLSMSQNYVGNSFHVPIIGTEEKGKVTIEDKKIEHKQVWGLAGYGLPRADNPHTRGSLIVRFEIQKDFHIEFPSNIEQSETTYTQQAPQDPPIEYELALALEQILTGGTISKTVPRTIFTEDGNEFVEKAVLDIEVPPGVEAGRKFIFNQHGNKYPGRIPADIVFTISEKEHPSFRRNGADIEHVALVTKKQMKHESKIVIPTLDDKKPYKLHVPKINNVISNIPGCGLPYADNPSERGNLVVHFRLVDEGHENTKQSWFGRKSGK